MKSAFLLMMCILVANALAAQPAPVTKSHQPNPIASPESSTTAKRPTILHDGENWTIVPNGAVVFLPENLITRINARPVGNLLPWPEFLAKNQSWITTFESTFDQAAGNEMIPAECSLPWPRQDKIVVAMHQNKPVSVRVSYPSNS